MNEDSGGPVQQGTYHLTEDEEAALLAEYGTEGPLDDNVDWAAPSHFKSQLGDGDVFLTGAGAAASDSEDAADAQHAMPGPLGDGNTSSRRAHTDPLTLYLLRTAPSLILPTKSMPASLAQPVSNLVDTLEHAEANEDSNKDSPSEYTSYADFRDETARSATTATSRFAPVLRSGKEWERRASLAVQGVPTSAFASYLLSGQQQERRVGGVNLPHSPLSAVARTAGSGGDDNATLVEQDAEYQKLMGETVNMLQDADQLLNRLTKTADAETTESDEAAVQDAIADLRRREALASEDVLDQHWEREEVLHADEEDARTWELLQHAQASRQRLCAALAAAVNERTGTASTDDAHKVGARQAVHREHPQDLRADLPKRESLLYEEGETSKVKVLPSDADYLYAFEMQLPRMEAALLTTDVDTGLAAGAAPMLQGQALRAEEEAPATRTIDTQRSVAPDTSKPTTETEDTLPQLLLRSSVMLDAIATAEQRDAELLRQFTSAQEERAQVKSRFQLQRCAAGPQVTKKRNRDALGLVALPSFVERLDVLLSPTQEEQQERARRKSNHENLTSPNNKSVGTTLTQQGVEEKQRSLCQENGTAVDATAAAPIVSPVAPPPSSTAVTLEQIRRQASIESFMLQRELEEARRMRREEEMIERELMAAEAMRNLHDDQRAALHADAVRARTALLAEEAAAFAELATAEVKDAALARQVGRLRQLQQVEALSYTLMMEWEVHREQLIDDEALSFRRLTRDAAEAKTQAVAATKEREAAEEAAARAYVAGVRKAFEAYRIEAFSSLTNEPREKALSDATDLLLPFRTTAWYRRRIGPLLSERAYVVQWAVSHRRPLESTQDLIIDAAAQYRGHLTAALPPKDAVDPSARVLRVPAAPPTKEDNGDFTTAGEAVSRAGSLTAERLLQILWPMLRAAVMAPGQAPQFLARWGLSLEDLNTIDWTALQSLALQRLDSGDSAAAANKSLVVGRFVKDVDLSGNRLGSVDVLQAVRAFPLLQRLALSHAGVNSLEAAELTPQSTLPQSQQLQRQGSARRNAEGSPRDRRVSSASLSASSHLRHISAARNHALAEQVHLLEVDVSANKLTSLTPLGLMATASLTRCAAVENRLTSLESIAACTQLRSIAVAHNQLRTVQSVEGLRLLRELDVGNNEVTQLADEAVVASSAMRSSTTTTPTNGQENSRSGAVHPIVLLSKLFASHNRLTRLPSSLQNVYPCLSQLFINHNQITALTAGAMAWFPLLRVLQAEGNKLTDITGLSHCTRLESVKLSNNQLSTKDALLPLASCRRLKILDVSGNPVFATSNGEAATDRQSQEIAETLLLFLPWLEEFNNSPIAERIAQQQQQQQQQEHSASSTTRGVPSLTANECTTAGPPACFSASPVSTTALCETNVSWYSIANVVDPSDLYGEVFAGLCWDDMVADLQDEREGREAVIARELNRARGWEATLTAQRESTAEKHATTLTGASASTAVAALYGTTAAQRDTRRAEQEAELRLFDLDGMVVSRWHAIAEQCTRGTQQHNQQEKELMLADPIHFANRHVVNYRYLQEEDDRLKKLARAFIAEWVLARVQICRARRELRSLRAAHRQSEAFRREAAARRIQPLWRGAALRSRLRRLLHGDQSNDINGDDDTTFAKVDVDDWMTEDAAALAPVELLLRTVVDSAGTVAAVPFNVPLFAPPTSGSSHNTGASTGNTRQEQQPGVAASPFTPIPPPPPAGGEPRRANTGNGAASGRPAPRLTQPRTESAAGRGSCLPAGQTAKSSATGAASLEEQWGPAVAAQLRKKQQKNARAHNERMRKEFLQDPLRVQHEMRGAQPGHKAK